MKTYFEYIILDSCLFRFKLETRVYLLNPKQIFPKQQWHFSH